MGFNSGFKGLNDGTEHAGPDWLLITKVNI